MNKKLIFSIFVVIIAGAGVLGYLEYQKKGEENPSGQITGIDISDWLTYRNEEYGFELKYPRDWKLYDCQQNYSHLNILLSDTTIKSGCDLNRGRISIFSMNQQTFINLHKKYDNYETSKVFLNNIQADKLLGYFEIKGGEGEKISSEPKMKMIETFFLINDDYINLAYYELFSLKEGVDSYGFKIDKDYTDIYNKIISSFRFV